MQADIAQDFQQFNCLTVLDRMLHLAMQTAEAASAEKNHKLVLQAVREVTRLVTLITKISGSADSKSKPEGKPANGYNLNTGLAPQTGKRDKTGIKAGNLGVLERFFKNNLPVKQCKENVGTHAEITAPKPPGQATVAGRWQDKPVNLAAEEIKSTGI